MQWFRWYHGTSTDLKFGRIARHSGQTRERVLFVWAMILEDASDNELRGTFDIEAGDIADVLKCDESDINAVMAAMCDAGIIDLDGDQPIVTAWQKRQPSRDDSAARQRSKRERDAGVTRPARDKRVTVTPLDTETDTDSETDSSAPNGAGAPSVAPFSASFEIPLMLYRPPGDDWSKALFGPGLAWLASTLEKPPQKCRSVLGQWLKLSGNEHREVFKLLADCERDGIAEPVAYITRALSPKPSQADELERAMASL